jgi:hypothetical protein
MTQVIINGTKQCIKCAEVKAADMFYKANRKGLRSQCKACTKLSESIRAKANPQKQNARQKAWREANPEKAKVIAHRHFEKNRDVMYKRTALWRETNREYVKELSRLWAKNNPSKMAAQASKRRAKLLSATPVWADFGAIQIEYDLADWCSKATGVKYHVDHIVPLQGKNVCGLHVPNNLQVIPAMDNLKKKNKFTAI